MSDHQDPPAVPDAYPAGGLGSRGAPHEPDLLDKIRREAALEFALGVMNAAAKRPISDNPYEPGSLKARAWSAGWLAHKERPYEGGDDR